MRNMELRKKKGLRLLHWPGKVGIVVLGALFMHLVVVPTATLANSRTDGYNECSQHNWKYFVGVGGGYVLFHALKHKKRLPENR